jgi:acetyl-CoA carboxylase biotin carboxylase subunit
MTANPGGGQPLRRVLIANRGEIALRVIRACRELGVQSVAVYSDADAAAPHVAAADHAVRIGPPPPAESYLNIPALLQAARDTAADAVHPGYGFLSERARFARAVEEAGLVFIGPSGDAIEHMGSKVGARALMEAAGVPVVPGEAPEDQSDESLVEAARRIGFPVLIKPSAGGGGIGMKVVRESSGLIEAVQAARREALAAFGDGLLYVERLVERPRHVEIQVFADARGEVVHLFERECSVQRRHQKMIEESPCPVLTPALRRRMGEAAVAAARAAGYRNAGTVEFLLDGDGDEARFYFLEMNTRLQVEHPVTELVAGVDLVHAQILVAGGAPLPWTQASLAQRGHAIECRIYAEDPAQQFLPQAGPLRLYREPQGPGIRVDSGVAEGGEVSVFYDPMLAKLIVWGETRAHATARAIAALERYVVLGIRTNIPFLLAILRHEQFRKAAIDTGFLDQNAADIAREAASDTLPTAALAAVAAHGHIGTTVPGHSGTAPPPSTCDPFVTLTGWRG